MLHRALCGHTNCERVSPEVVCEVQEYRDLPNGRSSVSVEVVSIQSGASGGGSIWPGNIERLGCVLNHHI